jgi:5-methylcytosine-specific restriction endonuclease McrA
VKARHAKYRAENREKVKARETKYRAENRERLSVRDAKYKKDNLEKGRVYTQRRRARKANAQGTHTADQLKARFDYHGNKCVYCNSTEDLHADHMIPLSRGGTNFASNMVPACGSCNRSKGAKTPIEFAEYTFKQLQAMLGK